MAGSYERALTGADVIARAASVGLDPDVIARIVEILDPAAEITGPDELVRLAGPARIGMAPGRWAHVFGPLFGEFE
jgi:hypothetical protein